MNADDRTAFNTLRAIGIGFAAVIVGLTVSDQRAGLDNPLFWGLVAGLLTMLVLAVLAPWDHE